MALLAARPPSGRGRPEAIPPGRAHQCSCTAGHGRPLVLRRALEFGRRPPADIRPAVPAAPPPAPGPDPVVVANPVAGTGATAYPSDLPPITTLSMVRSQPPFGWKLDLPGRKRAREEFVATTWEIEVETQDGAREPPLKMSFPCAITYPNPGGGWKEGERIIALYAYWLPGGHWRMDCCVQGEAGVPEGQLRRLAVLAVTGVRGWGDRVEEHMSYAWLQMLTRAKEEQRRHLGEVGGVVDVDAEEGEGEGDDASSMRSSRSGGSRGKVGRPRKAPKLPAKSGASPRLQSPRRQRTWTRGWRRRRGPCPSGKSGRWRQRGRFSSCGASSRRQSSGRRRRSGGQRQRSGSGTCCGRRPANPSPSRGSSRRWGERKRGGG